MSHEEGTQEQQPAPTEQKDVDFVSKSKYNEVQSQAEKLASLVDKLNQERESYKSKLESFGDLTPEEFKELKGQLQEYKTKDAGGDPEHIKSLLEEKESELRSEFGKLHEKDQSTIKELQGKLHELTVTSKVMDEHGGKVNDDMRSFIKDVVARSVDVDENTGQFVVKDQDGRPRYRTTEPDKRMTVEDLFEELSSRYPSAFRPKGVSKGGMQEGQQVQSASQSNFGNVDIERFKADREYQKQVPRKLRAEIYQKLGI